MEYLFLVSDNNVEYRGKKIVARVQFLVRGDMLLIFDSGDKKIIRFKSHERMRVIFIGHVVARFTRDKELKKDYPFSFNQLYSTIQKG